MTEFEAKVLEEIAKIRETLAQILVREKSSEERLGRVERICETCPARKRSEGYGQVFRDVLFVAAGLSTVAAAIAILTH